MITIFDYYHVKLSTERFSSWMWYARPPCIGYNPSWRRRRFSGISKKSWLQGLLHFYRKFILLRNTEESSNYTLPLEMKNDSSFMPVVMNLKPFPKRSSWYLTRYLIRFQGEHLTIVQTVSFPVLDLLFKVATYFETLAYSPRLRYTDHDHG